MGTTCGRCGAVTTSDAMTCPSCGALLSAYAPVAGSVAPDRAPGAAMAAESPVSAPDDPRPGDSPGVSRRASNPDATGTWDATRAPTAGPITGLDPDRGGAQPIPGQPSALSLYRPAPWAIPPSSPPIGHVGTVPVHARPAPDAGEGGAGRGGAPSVTGPDGVGNRPVTEVGGGGGPVVAAPTASEQVPLRPAGDARPRPGHRPEPPRGGGVARDPRVGPGDTANRGGWPAITEARPEGVTGVGTRRPVVPPIGRLTGSRRTSGPRDTTGTGSRGGATWAVYGVIAVVVSLLVIQNLPSWVSLFIGPLVIMGVLVAVALVLNDRAAK